MNAIRFAVISQKGGCGKSVISRTVATVFQAMGWPTMLADMDVGQGTSVNWMARREANDLPVFDVLAATNPLMAINAAAERGAECIVFDGAPHATRLTLDVAMLASMNLIPTGLALDDLLPAVQLAQSLQAHGVAPQTIAFVLNHAGDSEREIQEARDYLEAAGFYVVPGALRERTCYRLTLDQGRALTECQWAGAKDDAAQLMQAIINRLESLA